MIGTLYLVQERPHDKPESWVYLDAFPPKPQQPGTLHCWPVPKTSALSADPGLSCRHKDSWLPLQGSLCLTTPQTLMLGLGTTTLSTRQCLALKCLRSSA